MNPCLYQVNTRAWLTEIGKKLGRSATLDDIPDTALDDFVAKGFEWVWLLSVWAPGKATREFALNHPIAREEFKAVLPDLADEDIGGSGFSIAGYVVNPSLGGEAALARFRKKLAERKIRLALDFIPNHMAMDHPWLETHPDYFVDGTEEQIARKPQNYVRLKSGGKEVIKAHGRDPYFDGWQDTLQLNYANPGCYEAMADELLKVASMCDGVRCDMSMLLLPDIFERTWGLRPANFWQDVSVRVKKKFPKFYLMAEVYWDLDTELQSLGFDLTYDKNLYDCLIEGNARKVQSILRSPAIYLERSVHFLENHDEPRIASVLNEPQLRAAALITFLSPGVRFFHQGQFEGRLIRIPAQLVRYPFEEVNESLLRFYEQLLGILKDDVFHKGEWRLHECLPAYDGDASFRNFIAFGWRLPGKTMIVVVNYAAENSRCYLTLPPELRGGRFALVDLLGVNRGDAGSSEPMLMLHEPAWGCHVYEVR